MAPEGVYAAVLTPFSDRLEPDVVAFIGHCRWLFENGCDGLAPLGTTGEANSMSVDQRMTLLEALSESDLPRKSMIPGTGSCALADAVRVSKFATEKGFAGVLTLPPFYYKDPTQDGLFAFFSELIERVGDPRLRLFLYHIPNMSTVPIEPSLISRLVKAYPGTIAGLKDSSGDWANTATLIREFPNLAIYSGSERFLSDNLDHGGAGCISATTNVTCGLAAAVFAARNTPNAKLLQKELTEVRLTFERFPVVAALKVLKARTSGDDAWLNILPPLEPVCSDESQDLLTRLTAFNRSAPVPIELA
ncbi:MAG: dihydrodipicolinate synthase family protein [Alphaproteobacteria bacterium]|nr:dihydrodipicolinate synthase family protein [Alphaproteobacteria bacterium]